jgi:hypothetical protein
MLSVSRRVQSLKPSVTIAFMNRAKAMQRAGKDVLSFAAGEPDFDTPQTIKDAAIKALLAGQTKYMPTFGDPDTRAVLAKKLTEENGIPNCTADHISISAGGKHSLFVACHVLLDDSSSGGAGYVQPEVLIPVPAWVSYVPIAQLAGGKVIEIPTTVDTGFKASADQIRKAITPRTRLLILRKDHLRRHPTLLDRQHARDRRTHHHAQWLVEGLRHDRLAHRLYRQQRRVWQEVHRSDGDVSGPDEHEHHELHVPGDSGRHHAVCGRS